ncbi:MAG: glycosyltransferase family 4 protein [Phycisphaerales bacterium]
MRIIMLAEWLSDLGGCEHFVASLAGALSGFGHDIVVALATGEPHARWRSIAKVPIVSLAHSHDSPVDALAALTREYRADLIHAIPYERTAFDYAMRPDAIPVIGTEPSDGGDLCYWWYCGDHLHNRINSFDALHVFSSRAEQNLKMTYRYRGHIELIPPVCEFPEALPLWNRHEPSYRVAYLGRLAPEKGLGFALDVLADCKSRLPDRLQLDIWGDGRMAPLLRQMATAAGAGTNVRFRGGFNDAFEVPFDDYDCVIIPSYFEGLPFVFLESMWRGIPVAMTRHSGAPDLEGVSDLCQWVTPSDHESFIDAMLSLYSNYATLHQSAGARRDVVARHCHPSVVASLYINLYRTTVQRT